MSETLNRYRSKLFQSLLPRRKRHTKDLKKADPVGLKSKDGRSEVVNSYQYEPLPTREHTRVLVLGPGPNDDRDQPLVGSLRLLNLRDLDPSNHIFHRLRKALVFKTHEPFEAISYVWGPSEKTHTIIVDGRSMSITASLREALLQTRLPDRSRRLWADAICINQSDKNEKGHQVAEMGRIYKKTSRTLICLGVQVPEWCAQHAADLVDEVNLMIQNVQRSPNFSGDPGSFPFPAENDTILSDFRWWLGWTVMLGHPWFRRGWVLQEASLAPGACVLWSSVQIEWNAILRVNYWKDRRDYSAIMSRDGESPDSLVLHHVNSFARRHPEEAILFDKGAVYVKWASTLSTLFAARWLGLTDPRDRIYAFMALDTSDGVLADMQLEPDYERPFQKIYHEFAVKYIEMTGDLDILSYIKHNKESLASTAKAETIPSWVPRWDLDPRIIDSIMTETGCHPKTPIFTDKYCTLRVCGMILGNVEYSATQEPYSDYDQKSLALQDVISLWKEAVAASSMNGGPYGVRQALAFFDVLCPFREVGTFEQWSTWRHQFAQCLQSYLPEPLPASSISPLGEPATEQHSFKLLAERIHHGGPRRFVILSRGYYGVAPPVTEKGDLFAHICGNGTLSILRPVEGKTGHYQIVGPVCVESKIVLHPHESNLMGEEGCRDWEEWGLTEQDINLC